MSQMPRLLAWTGLAVLTAVLAGCPFTPTLSVTPATLAFGNGVTEGNIRLANTGGGTLRYTLQENLPWVKISDGNGAKQAGTLSGTVSGGVNVVRVALVENALPENLQEVRGEIAITSNGGNRTVIVSARKADVPVLRVAPAQLEFGLTGATLSFTVSNNGNGALEWTLGVPGTAPWLSATPVAGTLAQFGQEQEVTVRVDRAGLSAQAEPFSAALQVVSNGGNAQVAVSMEVPTFSVTPSALDFGVTSGAKSKALLVENKGAGAIPLTVTAATTDGAGWLTVGNAAPVLPGGGSLQLAVAANSAGLAPAAYSGSVTVAAPLLGYSQTIPVSMLVQGFGISAATVDFGVISNPATQSITLQNLGTTPLDWSAAVPAGAGWLSVAPASGTLMAQTQVTFTASPAAVDPGPHTANVLFNFGGAEATVTVSMVRPRPAALKVAPQEIDFGVSGNDTILGIWNDGVGTINWSIDTAGFPAWLSLAPVNAEGVASGTVSGDTTSTLTLQVNRMLAPEGQDLFQHVFQIAATGDYTTPVPVTVRASAPKLPEFVVTGEGVDGSGIPFLLFDIQETSQTFVISNTGNGRLSWRVDPAQTLPSWLTSVAPLQGNIEAGRQSTVTVTVNREGLSRAGGIHALRLLSNDPANLERIIELQVRVPYLITIGARPASIAFGRYGNTDQVEIANLGEPGEYLNFKVESTQPDWLYVDPARGRSIGVPSGLPKDWRPISVAVDRSRIPGTGAVAKLIVTAETVPPDAVEPEPVEISVSVDVAQVTVESAAPQLRPPSLVRMNFMLRDSSYSIFPSLLDNPADDLVLYDIGNVGVEFVEDSEPIDLSETSAFVKKDELLDFNLLVMLDFSGSMRAAAERLVEDGQLPEGLADPLKELYLRCVGPMLDEFPDHYRVALGVFNERRGIAGSPLRLIYGADPANPGLVNQAFVTNPDVLQHRLASITVEDYGATELLPAVLSGAVTLYNLDADDRLFPFDSSDEYALVVVTDGRRTTPPGDTGPVKDFLEATRIRFFPVGWGEDVQANPLIELSTGSGGHYYATETKLDAFGQKMPTLAGLAERCATPVGAAKPQSLPRDLQSHITLSYVSLNEEAAMSLNTRVEVFDTSPPVNGNIVFEQMPMALYANDVRLGQIGMRTGGIPPSGPAVVRIYSDYMPRNVNRLALRITVEDMNGAILPVAPAMTLVPRGLGGMMEDWNVAVAGNIYTFTAPAGRTFRYGDYGELVDVAVNYAAPFKVRLAVLDPVINNNPDGKYFTYPDTIPVDVDAFPATSFPRPLVVPDPPYTFTAPRVIDLGTDLDSATLEIFNIGGAHAPTAVYLNWITRIGTFTLPGTLLGSFTITPFDEALIPPVVLTETPGVCTITADRVLEPGVYSASFYVDYDYGTLPYFGSEGPIYVRYEVVAQELAVEGKDLDFGDDLVELPVKVTNKGQGSMEWSIDAGDIPVWMEVTSTGAILGPGESSAFNVRVRRETVPAGNYNKNVQIKTRRGATEVIQVHMRKN